MSKGARASPQGPLRSAGPSAGRAWNSSRFAAITSGAPGTQRCRATRVHMWGPSLSAYRAPRGGESRPLAAWPERVARERKHARNSQFIRDCRERQMRRCRSPKGGRLAFLAREPPGSGADQAQRALAGGFLGGGLLAAPAHRGPGALGTAPCGLRVHLEAVAPEQRPQLVVVVGDGAAHRLEALAQRLGALPEGERIQREEVGVLLPGLEQHDVALEAVVGEVALDAELEPRVQQRAEDLVDDDLHPAVREVAAVGEVRAAAALRVRPVQEGAERVVADDQIRTLLDRHVDVGGV